MTEFIRKHITVKAVQFNGENIREVQAFINGRDPITHGNYAAERWEEYCTKVLKDGYMQIPSSLGYDPTYTNCLPSDYVVSPSVGVYTVMGKETFEDQFTAWEKPTFDLKGKSVSDYFAEVRASDDAMRIGYGPIRLKPEYRLDVIAASELGGDKIEFSPSERQDPLIDALVDDLVKETERAIGQRDEFLKTGVSTAGHGGSHDTCFAVIIRKHMKLWTSMNTMLYFAETIADIKNAVGRIEDRLPVSLPPPNITIMLDDAAAVIRAMIRGVFKPQNEEEAVQIATHKHYKGGLYYKLFEALHTETQEGMTVYLHVWPNPPGAYARPQLMFEGKNDNGETRFEPLRCAD